VKTDNLRNPEGLHAVIRLIDDDTFLSVPEAISDSVDRELSMLLTPPEEPISPEEPVMGARVSMIRYLAERRLDSELPGSEEAFHVVLSIAEKGGWSSCSWIDNYFSRFPWPDADAALKELVALTAKIKELFLYRCILSAGPAIRRWIISFSASQDPPLSAYLTLLKDKEPGLVVEELLNLEQPAPRLLVLCADLYEKDERSGDVIRRIEETGCQKAAAYRALFEPAAAGAAKEVLDNTRVLDDFMIDDLVRRLFGKKTFPQHYPVIELVRRADHDLVRRNLDDHTSSGIRKAVLHSLT
jgi:hypothetical protein